MTAVLVRVDQLSTPDRWLRTRSVPSPLRTCPSPSSRGISVLRAKCCVPDGIASSGPRAVGRHYAREERRFYRRIRGFVGGRDRGSAVVARVKSGRRRTFWAATTRL